MTLRPTLTTYDCLPPERICAYVHSLVSEEEGVEIKRHLHCCDPCLLDLKEAMRVTTILAAARWAPSPPAKAGQ